MKGKKQTFPPKGTPVSHEILAKLRNIWKRFFGNCFNTTIRVTKYQLNLFNMSRISCGWERVNVEKTKLIMFRSNNLKLDSSFKFKLLGKRFMPTQSVKCLGVLLDEHLQWTIQLSHVKMKLDRAIGILTKLRYKSNSDILKITYHSLFGSQMSAMWMSAIWMPAMVSEESMIIQLNPNTSKQPS